MLVGGGQPTYGKFHMFRRFYFWKLPLEKEKKILQIPHQQDYLQYSKLLTWQQEEVSEQKSHLRILGTDIHGFVPSEVENIMQNIIVLLHYWEDLQDQQF